MRIELAESLPGGLAAVERIPEFLAPASFRKGEEELIVYRTPSPKETNPAVIAALVALGGQVVSVSLETRTLEEVYAAMVGEERTSTMDAVPLSVPSALVGGEQG